MAQPWWYSDAVRAAGAIYPIVVVLVLSRAFDISLRDLFKILLKEMRALTRSWSEAGSINALTVLGGLVLILLLGAYDAVATYKDTAPNSHPSDVKLFVFATLIVILFLVGFLSAAYCRRSDKKGTEEFRQ